MNLTRIFGILLISAGCLGLIYGGFSYTRESTAMKVGPVEIKVQEKESVTVPLLVSLAGIAAGVFLLAGLGRKSG